MTAPIKTRPRLIPSVRAKITGIVGHHAAMGEQQTRLIQYNSKGKGSRSAAAADTVFCTSGLLMYSASTSTANSRRCHPDFAG